MRKLNYLKILVIIQILFALFIFNSCEDCECECENEEEEITDLVLTDSRDGESYDYIKIGEQYWMSENLRYKPSTGYVVYNNDMNNLPSFGYLYSPEIMDKVCPDGWHIPSYDEWLELIDFAGGTSIAGGKLKVTGFMYWNQPNTGATNEFNFNAYGGGSYIENTAPMPPDKIFSNLLRKGNWLTSTSNDGSNNSKEIWIVKIENDKETAILEKHNYFPPEHQLYYSIRCVKD